LKNAQSVYYNELAFINFMCSVTVICTAFRNYNLKIKVTVTEHVDRHCKVDNYRFRSATWN